MQLRFLASTLFLLLLSGCGVPDAPKTTQSSLPSSIPEEPKPTPMPEPTLAAAPKTAPQRPWTYNYALAIHGATAIGGDHPRMLIDGNSTTYTGAEGYSQTDWTVKPTPSMVVTFKESETINTIRILLWDQDNRFYRYKLDVSPDADGETWKPISDRSAAGEYRSWQLHSFPAQAVRRMRVTGTFNSIEQNNMFHVVEFQAFNIPAGVTPNWEEKKIEMPSAASKTGGTTREW